MNARPQDAVAGSRFDFTTAPVTTEQLVRYAGASGDYARIHYDPPFAIEAGLGGLIAHGMLTMAFMAHAATQWGGARCQVRRVAARFNKPVRPGDRVHVQGVVLERRSHGGRDEIRCELVARVGEAQVASGEATLTFALVPKSVEASS